MGRLIDADLLISQASKYHMFDYVTIKGLVHQQPTAYDVDKVVEKLEYLKTELVNYYFSPTMGDIADKFISIVKGGSQCE